MLIVEKLKELDQRTHNHISFDYKKWVDNFTGLIYYRKFCVDCGAKIETMSVERALKEQLQSIQGGSQ